MSCIKFNNKNTMFPTSFFYSDADEYTYNTLYFIDIWDIYDDM